MNKVLEEISKIGIVPVIALDDVKDAEPLAKALIDGGLPCAEVTFRTAAAEESIRIMSSKFPNVIKVITVREYNYESERFEAKIDEVQLEQESSDDATA
ncbi:MAG: hypothetical protein J6J86_09610, partial [Lachnospiraceae bacterium]|nr:hypothetical protein [Lachnospiraceae bacterium]